MTVPKNVQSLLQNNHYLHLGTSKNDVPHVSLMNYTYVPKGQAQPYDDDAVIILATPRSTQKFENISANPKVSLLIHDWVSAKNIDENPASGLEQPGGIAQFLANLNQSQMSSLSATFNGQAKVLSGDAEKFFRDILLKSRPEEARCFIEGSEVILVKLQSVTVTDTHNNVSIYDM